MSKLSKDVMPEIGSPQPRLSPKKNLFRNQDLKNLETSPSQVMNPKLTALKAGDSRLMAVSGERKPRLNQLSILSIDTKQKMLRR